MRKLSLYPHAKRSLSTALRMEYFSVQITQSLTTGSSNIFYPFVAIVAEAKTSFGMYQPADLRVFDVQSSPTAAPTQSIMPQSSPDYMDRYDYTIFCVPPYCNSYVCQVL